MSLARVVILCLCTIYLFSVPFVICGDTIQEPSDKDYEDASRDPVTVDVNVSPALSENEMYRDILHLTNENFTDIVLKTKDPWVIIFHDGSFYKTWKTMAASMRGILWVGLVNKNEEPEILNSLKINKANVPPALVIPYNYFANVKTRKEKAVRVKTPLDARKRAVNSLPDSTIKLDKDSVQDFLIESYVGSPAKFPTIFMTYERETPALIKALCVRFSEYFHFGIMYDPNPEDLKAVGLAENYLEFPSLMVLVAGSSDSSAKEPSLSAVFFDTAKMGDLNYPNIVRFLFQMNEQYRVTVPGDNLASDKRVATMSDVLAIESKRFKIIGIKEFADVDETKKEQKEEL